MFCSVNMLLCPTQLVAEILNVYSVLYLMVTLRDVAFTMTEAG